MADKQTNPHRPSIQDVFSIVSDSDAEAKRTKLSGKFTVEFSYQEGQYQGVQDTRTRYRVPGSG